MCSILNSYKIVRKNITNIIILASLLFTGCSLSVPEPDETNQTLLIIPVETIQNLKKFIYTVNFTIEDSNNKKVFHRIEPNPDTFFSYKSKLKPGKYKITELYAVANPGFKVGKKKKQRLRDWDVIEIQLEKGKATIVNKKLLIQQPEQIGGKISRVAWQNMNEGERNHAKVMRKKKRKERNKKLRAERFRNIEVHDLDDDFKAKLMGELKEVENIEKWEIVER
jgi:hypothetical protein